MTPKELVRYHILNYPAVSRNALEVYNHIFLDNGNGYHWVYGEPTSYGIIEIDTIEQGIIKEINKIRSYPLIHQYFDNEIIRNAMTLNTVLDATINNVIDNVQTIINVDKLVDDFSFETIENQNINKDVKYMFYPLSEYSLICNLPNDIDDNWLNAAKYMYQILDSNRDRVMDDNNYMDYIKNRLVQLSD